MRQPLSEKVCTRIADNQRSLDRACVVATEASAMAARTPENPLRESAQQGWAQTSFLAEEVSASQRMSGPDMVAEAVGAADHAVDQPTRRAALDRLSAHLMPHALRRGRTPVPKRVI